MALVVLRFLLGYAFYSVACAAAGALVSRQEDLSATSTPIVAVLAGSFLLSLAAIDFGRNPSGTVAQIAAFVPPTAPMVVPTRVVAGDMGAIAVWLWPSGKTPLSELSAAANGSSGSTHVLRWPAPMRARPPGGTLVSIREQVKPRRCFG